MGIVLTMIRVELSPKELNTFTDAMTTFTLCENQLRATVFNAGRFISQMRAQHGLGILETLCLGTGSLCAALFIPTMKGYERAILNYETDGIVSGFSVEACSEGWVRGYLREKHIPLTAPLESWDLAPFFGEGFVSVTKFKEGATEPMTGTVPITHKNIAQDVSEYFLQSEQTHTAIKTGIAFSRTGEVEAAGAFLFRFYPMHLMKIFKRLNKSLPIWIHLLIFALSLEKMRNSFKRFLVLLTLVFFQTVMSRFTALVHGKVYLQS